jgi:hypothetical protein
MVLPHQKWKIFERTITLSANATASRRISIMVEDIETHEKSEYISLVEAGEALGVSKAAVSEVLLNNRLVKKRYTIKRKT